MKKLILTAILAAILPAYLAGAADSDPANPTVKPKQGQGPKPPGGKCNGKNGKPKKKDKGQDAPPPAQ